MPEKKTQDRARADKRAGKSASTQAGEYVHEEIEQVREGKHGARSAKQAIAIGLSKARRAGVKAPVKKTASKATKKKAAQDTAASHRKGAAKKTSAKRSTAAKKAARTKGPAVRKAAAKKAARKRAAS